MSTDLTVGDDLFMLSDSAVIHFGADSDITMTHVADTGLTIQNSGNAVATLLLKSTDADENIGPSLHLHRDSANAADNDETGQIVWRFDNDAQEDTEGFKIKTLIKDASNGTEDFQFDMQTIVAGSIRSRMKSDGTETVFNEDSVDLDFRVETDNSTNAFVIEGSTGKTRFNTDTTDNGMVISNGADTSGNNACFGLERGSYKATIGMSSTGTMTLKNFAGEIIVIDSGSNATTISPHNFSVIPGGASEEMAWSYYGRLGDEELDFDNSKFISADMTKVIRKVENLTGEKLIYKGVGSTDDGSTVSTNIIQALTDRVTSLESEMTALKARVTTLEE